VRGVKVTRVDRILDNYFWLARENTDYWVKVVFNTYLEIIQNISEERKQSVSCQDN